MRWKFWKREKRIKLSEFRALINRTINERISWLERFATQVVHEYLMVTNTQLNDALERLERIEEELKQQPKACPQCGKPLILTSLHKKRICSDRECGYGREGSECQP